MKKGIIIGAAVAGLAVTLVGGAALLHGAHAEAGWHGGPGGWMETSMGAGPGFGRGERGIAMLEQFDRSGDGQVSQEDVMAVRGERLAAFDTNGDGILSLDEYERLWLDAMQPRMVRSFQRLDADGDANVTIEEFQVPFAGMVARLDVDGDGLIDADELRQSMRVRHDERRGERRGRGQERMPQADD